MFLEKDLEWSSKHFYSTLLYSKVIESQYIALFVVSVSVKKIFLIDRVNIYFSKSITFANIFLFSLLFSTHFKSVGLPQFPFDSLTLNQDFCFFACRSINKLCKRLTLDWLL